LFPGVNAVEASTSPLALPSGFVTRGGRFDPFVVGSPAEDPILLVDGQARVLHADRFNVVLDTEGDLILLGADGECGPAVALFDASRQALVWRHGLAGEALWRGAKPWFGFESGAILGDHVVYAMGDHAGALDLRTGERRDLGERLSPLLRQCDEAQSHAPGSPSASCEPGFAVFAPTLDKKLWSRELPAEQCIVRVESSGPNVAVLWGRTPANSESVCGCGETQMPWFCETRLEIVELETGKPVFAFPWLKRRSLETEHAEFIFSGAQILRSVAAKVQGVDARAVELRSAASGALRLTTPATPCGEVRKTQLAATETEFYVCGCDGILRRFDRTSGKATGRVGVGKCESPIAVSNGRVAVPETRECSDEDCPPRLLLIDPDAFKAPEVTRVVRGRVTPERLCDYAGMSIHRPVKPPHRVLIGDRLVVTDAKGQFQTTLRGKGIYGAAAVIHPNWEECHMASGRPTFVLEGEAPEAPIDVEIELWEVEGGGP
jgi:hypothetical protein